MKESWHELDEDDVIEFAQMSGPGNAFLEILLAGAEYKKANLTPVYMYDENNQNIKVVAEELIGKLLH